MIHLANICFAIPYRVVLESRYISLHSTFHVSCCNQSRCQVDISIDEVRLEAQRVAIMLNRLLQLTTLLKHIAQVGVGLSKHGILLDGQCAEVSRPALQS